MSEFNSAFEAVQSVHSLASWPSVLGAFSTLLLLSGLDDLIPLLICSVAAIRRSLSPQKRSVTAGLTGNQKEERRIAVFVPCWRESAVIGNMVRHNLAAIRYSSYTFFLGVYPNDEETVRVARLLAEEFTTKVYVAQCPNLVRPRKPTV